MKTDETSVVASGLIQQKLALEEVRKKDSLAKKLSLRPTKQDLEDKNIIRVSNTSDESPTMEERRIALKSCLKKRPEKEELKQQNILKGDGSSAAIIAAKERLRKSLLADTLERKISERPSVVELQESKILLFSETVEVLPTFRKSEYNRRPDSTSTFKNLTPAMKVEIREELNNFKKSEMEIHESSTQNTCFH